ncbi:hypothetical protein AVEN_134752-1 [Araneus ventricosus]|uniref:Uncharacterized protein n=1 Tax=Araneus ventricosus TaxID=182803 RepID=A0A4Y2SEC1_ARAVE|nr:hypothetical protein AVEN_134752-1 [Araneus ventricosus]
MNCVSRYLSSNNILNSRKRKIPSRSQDSDVNVIERAGDSWPTVFSLQKLATAVYRKIAPIKGIMRRHSPPFTRVRPIFGDGPYQPQHQ